MVDMNWYINTKQRIIILNMALIKIEKVLSKLVLSQPWMLEHSNLFESYTKLQEIHNINIKSIKNIIRYMKYLDNKEDTSFNSDIVNEVDIIQENISLESTFLMNIIRFIITANDYHNSELQNDALMDYFNYETLEVAIGTSVRNAYIYKMKEV